VQLCGVAAGQAPTPPFDVEVAPGELSMQGYQHGRAGCHSDRRAQRFEHSRRVAVEVAALERGQSLLRFASRSAPLLA
jgi:hypothetical protein